MFFNNGGNSCCGSNFQPFPVYWGNYGSNSNNNYAIILVLFILLVIVIGARNSHN